MATIWGVGDPLKKVFLDWLKDRINGDNAEATGAGGHNHTGAGTGVQLSGSAFPDNTIPSAKIADGAIIYGKLAVSSVGRNELKIATQEVSTASAAGVNLTLSSVLYGFYPRVKKSVAGTSIDADFGIAYNSTSYTVNIWLRANGGATAYAEMAYVTATRNSPIIWLTRNKTTGEIESMIYDPETSGDRHPFVDYLNKGIPAHMEVCFVELKQLSNWQELIDKKKMRGIVLETFQTNMASGLVKLKRATQDNYAHILKKDVDFLLMPSVSIQLDNKALSIYDNEVIPLVIEAND